MKVVFNGCCLFFITNLSHLYHMLIVVFYFLLISTFFFLVVSPPNPDLGFWIDHVVQD